MDAGTGTPTNAFHLDETVKLRPLAALGSAWGTFTSHVWISLGAMLLLCVLMLAGNVIPFVNVLFGLLVSPALAAGGARFLLRTARRESPGIDTIFDGFKRWPSATGAMLLQSLVALLLVSPVIGVAIATIGVAALMHLDRPGAMTFAMFLPTIGVAVLFYPLVLAWTCRTWPVFFVVLEPECTGAVDALQRSWALTRGSIWRSIGLFLLALPVEILGLIALCVGVFPAIIVLYYAFAHGYEQLRQRAGLTLTPAATQAPPPGIVV